jgi:hypothetical protein
MDQSKKHKTKAKEIRLTTGCNDVLVIVPWNWSLDHYTLILYMRK